MKPCISNIAWEPSENDAIVEILESFGVSNIEVSPKILFKSPTEAKPEKVKRTRDYWNERGFKISAMQSLLYGHPELTLFKTLEQRDRTLKYLKKIIELASALGAKSLVFGSPRNRVVGSLPKNEIYKLSIKIFTEIGEIAKENNVYFCLEPNASDYGCDFINNTSEAVDLVAKVGHPNFQIILDTGTMLINGESIIKSINMASAFLRHFHISAPFLGPISECKADHEKISACLEGIGYRDLVSIEMKSENFRSNADNVKESFAFIQKYYSN